MSFDTGHFWPGGIPASLPIYQGKYDWTHDPRDELIKGWLLFVKEICRVDQTAGIAEDEAKHVPNRCRQLMLQWASSSQAVREDYHSRALPQDFEDLWYSGDVMQHPRYYPDHQFICLAQVGNDNPINRARWFKLLILVNRFDLVWENPFAWFEPHFPLFFAESISSNLPNISSAARWIYLENPSFGSVHMTRSGEVIFDIKDLFIVDQKDLEEGFVSLVKYGYDGELLHHLRVRPWHMSQVLRDLSEGRTIDERLDPLRASQFFARQVSIDMDAPILETLQNLKDASHPRSADFKSTDFALDVETYVPGYLDLEKDGRAAEYEFNRLLDLFRDEAGLPDKPNPWWDSMRSGASRAE